VVGWDNKERFVLTDTTTAIGAAAAEAWGPSAKQEHRDSGLTFTYKLNIGGCCCCNCFKQVRKFSQTPHP